MTGLPEAFCRRMRQMLGDQYDVFIKSYQAPRQYGLRVNTMKVSPERFAEIAPFPVRQIPWIRNGFFYEEGSFPSRHPYFAAGLYYLQEPSAMTPASRLPVEPGDSVLDLCAAPGGKATELAARLDGTGILVANEISNSRAKALLRNLELFGTANSFVTNEQPQRLAAAFPCSFDKIMVDAPCSGEGMFRKQPDVAAAWSPERVHFFANLQRSILEEAVRMLRPGGMLMYSTCTFSPEEDEGTVSCLLENHPEMRLAEMEPYEGFADGVPAWGGGNPELRRCKRIWPHHMDGEGHFMALFRKMLPGETKTGTGKETEIEPEKSAALERQQKNILQDSGLPDRQIAENGVKCAEKRNAGRKNTGRGKAYRLPDEWKVLTDFFAEEEIPLPKGKPEFHGEKAYVVPALPAAVCGLHFLRNGIYLGNVRKGRFEPSQPLAMAIHPDSMKNVISFRPEDERLQTYLSGGTIRFPEESDIRKGWNLICVDQFPLGWGKYAAGVLKNKYAVTWRKN